MAKTTKSAVSKKPGIPSKKPSAVKKTPGKVASANVSADRVKSGEELVVENFAAVSRLVDTLGETLELLTQKAENMAYHIIATEELLAELIADNGINLARVNNRIRLKIASGTDNTGDSGKAIDIAASIVSPLPRR